MYLYINTANSEYIVLSLIENKLADFKLKKIKAQYQQSEKLLVNIEKLVGKNLKKIKGVIAVQGPGGFTALRIGIAVANSLACALDIPIVGAVVKEDETDKDIIKRAIKRFNRLKKFRFIVPEYGKEPNITIKKKKNKK